MVAVNIKNCAHIISTPASISCDGEMRRDVNARATAVRNEPMATKHSAFFDFTIFQFFNEPKLTKQMGLGMALQMVGLPMIQMPSMAVGSCMDQDRSYPRSGMKSY